MTAAKQGSDMCTSGLTQGVALRALRAGLVERIQPGVVALYRARRDALCDAMATHLMPWFDWEKPAGGMFVWAVARDPALDTDRLLPLALKAGVCVTPGSVFDPTGANRRAIRINFTLNDADRLAEGVRRLAVAVTELQSGGG
jgi:2-aminoadipate transaminase